MKKTSIRTFLLAALVGITANAAHAKGTSLETTKHESGIEFGEMGGLKTAGSSAVNASNDGVSHPMLASDIKAIRERSEGGKDIPPPPRPGSTRRKLMSMAIAPGMILSILGIGLASSGNAALYQPGMQMVAVGVIALFASIGVVLIAGLQRIRTGKPNPITDPDRFD